MGNPPVQKFPAENGITVDVWNNKTTRGSFYTISMQRRYKDKNGTWQTASNYNVDHIPKLVEALNKAVEYCQKNPIKE